MIGPCREKFQQYSPTDGSLRPEELVLHWCREIEADRFEQGVQRAADEDEKKMLALCVAQLLQKTDLVGSGRIRSAEWAHYKRLAASGLECLFKNQLRRLMQTNPKILEELQRLFDIIVGAKKMNLATTEIVSRCPARYWKVLSDCDMTGSSDNTKDGGQAFLQQVIECTVSGSERVAYPKFIASCLRREPSDVTLYLYDISSGTASSLAPTLLGQEIEAIWHVGVVVYGLEYYFCGGLIMKNDPGMTDFGKPVRILEFGSTLWTMHELHNFIIYHLKPCFHRESYDIKSNNCQHFANRVSMFLVDKPLPSDILGQSELLFRHPGLEKYVRPFLNWYCNEWSQPPKKRDTPSPKPRFVKSPPAVGQLVNVHPAVGMWPIFIGIVYREAICTEEQGQVIVKYFCDDGHPPYFETELLPINRLSAITMEDVGGPLGYQALMANESFACLKKLSFGSKARRTMPL